jgi:glutathione-regulated potassium-efflux system ancillary protein KefG
VDNPSINLLFKEFLMRKILILFAHPRFEHSVANQYLVNAATKNPHVTFHDLYEQYPDFDIDVKREQALLVSHDVIIWQHPFYWYSCPPLLKQWIDLVLEFNWAYGPKGVALAGKTIFNVLTTGGTREAYQPEGRNRFSVNQLLSPFDQTAYLCKMKYLPPFAVQGTHRLLPAELEKYAADYSKLLNHLAEAEVIPPELASYELLNDYMLEIKK